MGEKRVKYRQWWRVNEGGKKGGRERASGGEERTPMNLGAGQIWGEGLPLHGRLQYDR